MIFSPILIVNSYLCSMLSKAVIKFVRALELKKNRLQQHLFVAEGPKVVGDLLKVAAPKLIIATEDWISGQIANTKLMDEVRIEVATDDELQRASFLQHPQQVIAVFPFFDGDTAAILPQDQLCIALDGVQDPGNLGTIIRVADWFGIEHLFCSEDTADVYNPKVVQATMGSIARVGVHYQNLCHLLDGLPKDFPVYGTFLDGENIYEQELLTHGLIIMGNEGNGLSHEVSRRLNHRLYIPNYPADRVTAESLNVAIATAIVCSEFRRPHQP